jgi:hypothetical protein
VLAGRAFELDAVHHGHSDGSWHEMEEVESQAATQDPERGWLRGVIYRCKSCSDEVRVVRQADAETATESLTTPD